MMRFEELALSSNDALEQIFRTASAPAPETLIGYEWRGYNMTPVARLLGIQKFIKGFFSSEGRIEGYNIRARQNGLTDTWVSLPIADHPKRYAFYCVTPVDAASRDNLYPDALLLNYGASPRNPRLAVARI